ncbi:MAG: Nramp family divalent metal transporter [Flavobacteriales bacterium]|nr:Nramp family divalent metal transporter [Flavobacteriales bacterium]
MRSKSRNPLTRIWRKLGPGLVTGASDDDPSGIATYSQAGAAFGTQLLWTPLLTYPLMVAVQEMCARIGMVTGHGLMGVIRQHYSPWVVRLVLIVSLPSILLNIGANIAGMGAVGAMLVPSVPPFLFSIAFTALLLYATVVWSYRRIAKVMKWLCLILFCYVLIPLMIDTDWWVALRNTFIPTLSSDKAFLMALVGILGTTISPYLFFWQASMEVEERLQRGLVVDRKVIGDMETDVRSGMLLSNVVFYFIVLTCGTVLHGVGMTSIETVDQAAEALRPLVGNMAHALFAFGVIGTGFLAIPVLGGALSYMMAEVFDWPEGLDKKFHEAPGFYITLIVALVIGLFILFSGITPFQALLWTAVLYGVTAPVLIALILRICNDRRIMGDYTNSRRQNIVAVITLVVMTAAAMALLLFGV